METLFGNSEESAVLPEERERRTIRCGFAFIGTNLNEMQRVAVMPSDAATVAATAHGRGKCLGARQFPEGPNLYIEKPVYISLGRDQSRFFADVQSHKAHASRARSEHVQLFSSRSGKIDDA